MRPVSTFLRFILPGCLLLVSASGCQSQVVDVPESGGAALDGRGEVLLQQVAEAYQPADYSDRGKYSFPVVIARLLRNGAGDERAETYLEEYSSGKYTFFHFPFVGMARILGLFPDHEVISSRREAFLRDILFHDARYHYNALTGEGTENHVSMSRTSGYLFAQEAMAYPELRERAAEWMEQLHPWILDWSRRIYAYGTGEWNSNPYTTYNLVGWLNLYDFAEDPDVRKAARAVLDYYAANLALKLTQGLLGGPESRGSARFGRLPRSATEYLGWIWFGPDDLADHEEFFGGSEYIQAVHAATSGYRPPPELKDLALKTIPKPALYHNTKPDYLLTEKALSHEVFLIGQSFTLGTAQTPLGGWTNASYGLINWKLVMEDPAGRPALLSGNGGMKSTSHPRGRNPFDQFLQYRNTVVQMTRVPSNASELMEAVSKAFHEWRDKAHEDFKQRWGRDHQFHDSHISETARGSLDTAHLSILHLVPAMPVELHGSHAFLRYAGTYVHLQTLSGKPPVATPDSLNDSAEPDAVAGFVIEVNPAGDYASFEAFREACLDSRPPLQRGEDGLSFTHVTSGGDVMEFHYQTAGEWTEMIFDWGYGVREKRIGYNSPEWKQAAWPSGEGHGRIAELRVDGKEVLPGNDPPVIEGPWLRLADSVMTITDPAGRTYRVDYSGKHPRFSRTAGLRPEKTETDAHGMRDRQD